MTNTLTTTSRPWATVRTWMAGLVMAVTGSAGVAAPLTLAVGDSTAFASGLVAEAEGFFAAEGLNLTVIHCVNGKRCLKHLLDGEAHYATAADTPLALASLAGGKFEIVATLGTTSRENHFVARADRGIKNAANLKGKRIGFVKGTSGHYFVDTLLLFYGLMPSQVTMVPLEGGDSAAALVRGDVDAAGLYQPWATQAETQLGANKVIITNPKIFTMQVNLVSVPSGQAGMRDEDTVKVLRAFRRATQLLNDNPARAREIIAARFKLDPAKVQAVLSEYDFEMQLGQPLITTLEAQARWALREGMVSGGQMPDYLDYVRVEPLKALDRKAVTLVK